MKTKPFAPKNRVLNPFEAADAQLLAAAFTNEYDRNIKDRNILRPFFCQTSTLRSCGQSVESFQSRITTTFDTCCSKQ
jgi:hypothetical protein